MRRYFLIFLITCLFILTIMFYKTSTKLQSFVMTKNIPQNKEENCLKIEDLQKNLDIPILILDEKYLEKFQNKSCEEIRKIEIAVDLKYSENRKILQDPRFKIIFFENSTAKDFLNLITVPRKIIPKRFEVHHFGNLIIPENIPIFLEFLKRSTFLECQNITISRKDQKAKLDAQKSVNVLAELRDLLLDFGMFSFLNCGTFLGWYRECSIIPHTSDMDLTIFIEDINADILNYFETENSTFILSRKFGRLNDSLEFTVYSKSGYRVKTDIFFMYSDFENGTNMNWIGGTGGNGQKYKFLYPDYDPWCAADLLGHIFWVTCTPEYYVKFEHGEFWYKDVPTSHYHWANSAKNMKLNGKWTEEEMKTVYYIRN
ncbi:unnamed protein product [Caenorhabditis angaria]|uniref:W02B3.4-like N-terminal domain-containing protein n=1 Tax=Caenorhabditis angaria TaxID=860376 RepID=A0A9P1IEP7_9PELO|nr:unnamed protein product [Caenorhabditis angaria]